MPYPEAMVTPMREELTRLGVAELRDAQDVDAAMDQDEGTMLVVINSVCGCAAANARPAVAMTMQAEVKPDRFVTVFAGQDLEATERMRDKMPGIPPSSPFMALFRDGEPVYVVERRHIEGRSAQAIAADLVEAYEIYCGEEEPPADARSQPEVDTPQRGNGNLPGTFRSIM